MALVLVIEDDERIARMLGRVAEMYGHEVIVETHALEALAKHLSNTEVRAVMSDFMMPHMSGVEVLTVFQDSRPDVRRILVTAAPRDWEVMEAQLSGLAQVVISKPPMLADFELALAWLD